MTRPTDLPFVDRHVIPVDARPDSVWNVLAARVRRRGEFIHRGGGAVLARLLGRRRPTSSGAATREMGGLEVAQSEPPAVLELVGAHRFARYAIRFGIEAVAESRSHLSVETRAAFDGRAGRIYEKAVISSGVHTLAVHHVFLRPVARRASGGSMPGHLRATDR